MWKHIHIDRQPHRLVYACMLKIRGLWAVKKVHVCMLNKGDFGDVKMVYACMLNNRGFGELKWYMHICLTIGDLEVTTLTAPNPLILSRHA